ncbi:hypothetical protein RRG08_017005 [Elysia crispata]|uniref:Uncharacterized protein n=1 Tax=Elysia crispata TaxID=231223 RepID=A0AAE0XYX9_9GAST|nr:hypothetical protein RRG08_017005 [Elysia crispata]
MLNTRGEEAAERKGDNYSGVNSRAQWRQKVKKIIQLGDYTQIREIEGAIACNHRMRLLKQGLYEEKSLGPKT